MISSDLDSLKEVFPDLALLLIKFSKSNSETIATQALQDLNSLIIRHSERENSEKHSNPQTSTIENKYSGISDSNNNRSNK